MTAGMEEFVMALDEYEDEEIIVDDDELGFDDPDLEDDDGYGEDEDDDGRRLAAPVPRARTA